MLHTNTQLPALAVVLGDGMTETGHPEHATVLRAETGVQLARALPTLDVILAGDGRVHAEAEVTAATALSAIFRQCHIEPERIMLEDASRDVIAQVVLVAARYLSRMAPRKLFIVTSPYQAELALLLFRGVLGMAWPIELSLSMVSERDDRLEAMQPQFIEEARHFLSGIQPGDWRAALQRLLHKEPFYATLDWLGEVS